MHPLERYLRDLNMIRSSGLGVAETSYYAPLTNLLNDVGAELQPTVQCVMTLANRGVGHPDGGLYVAERGLTDQSLLEGHLPDRGAIEVKPTSDDAWIACEGEQVTRYWSFYRLVLVTNYYSFALIGRSEDGRPTKLETYRLANNEAAFWTATGSPGAVMKRHGEAFISYLKRVMLQDAPLSEPQHVAWLLASYAKEAKARVESADLASVGPIKTILEDGLGLRFEAAEGIRFFQSSLVQTLFYGLFSAWVLWAREAAQYGRSSFNWREAAWFMRIPAIQVLFEQIAIPSTLSRLNLAEVLDWAAGALNRVDKTAFFSKFQEEHAVQYFYEPFLEAFDKRLRKALGIWYTPEEVVKYMVARVDSLLRNELGLADGLASPSVYVVDPCAGTGSFLAEAVRRIADTLRRNNGDALVADDLKRIVLERMLGFEILPAPFVIAHLQLGLVLQSLGVHLRDGERIGVYLTNALTGDEPPDQAPPLASRELETERAAASRVKREVPILVVMGNPPYNAFAGISPAEERGLVAPYKQDLATRWGVRKYNLDDLYIRFFRLAERRIAEMTGRGVVCYITNFSYLDEPSFVVMREHLLKSFDKIWIDNLNGDTRETGKVCPDGTADPSIFSTKYNRAGIRTGTAIGLLVRKPRRARAPSVRYRDFWGSTKRAALLASLNDPHFEETYIPADPSKDNFFSFRPSKRNDDYNAWPTVHELASRPPFNGLMEKRKGMLIDMAKSILEQRMRAYFTAERRINDLGLTEPRFAMPAAGYEPEIIRDKALFQENFHASRLRRYVLRPLDAQWCYYSLVGGLWNRCRPEFWRQCWDGNSFLVTRVKTKTRDEGIPFYYTKTLFDDHLLTPDACGFPLYLRENLTQPRIAEKEQMLAFGCDGSSVRPNLSDAAVTYLTALGIAGNEMLLGADLLWMSVLAVGFSPSYLADNQAHFRKHWPRVPLPNSADSLRASASLGHELADLLDADCAVEGVTSGSIRPELKVVGVISRVGGGTLDAGAGDLALSAGWGFLIDHTVQPGRGRVLRRSYDPFERDSIKGGGARVGLSSAKSGAALGESCLDVYLNEQAYWRGIPEAVWNYRIGGHRVLKKWLSYRAKGVVGRTLTLDEAREFTQIARRLTAIIWLYPRLEENYCRIKECSYQWPPRS